MRFIIVGFNANKQVWAFGNDGETFNNEQDAELLRASLESMHPSIMFQVIEVSG